MLRAAKRAKSRTARGGPRALAGGRLRACLLLLQGVALCLVLNLSGAVHFAIDLWLHGEAAAQHFSEENGDDDENCPPGCASCHCVHVSPALPVPFAALAESRLLPAFEVTWTPYEKALPPTLAPPGVYRPPRA